MRTCKLLIAALPALLSACTAMSSRPDFVTYVPHRLDGSDGTNQHFLVTPTPAGSFLAFWTQATHENDPNQHVAMSRSVDEGRTWSKPATIAGDTSGKTGRIASWQFPVISPKTQRIYLFYNQNVGIVDAREDTTGALMCRWSGNDGLTWSQPFELPIRKSALSNPEPGSPENWVVYQQPIITSKGEVIVGFTRWASKKVQKEGNLFERDSEVWFLRFDNILTEPDPTKLTVTTLPDGDHGLRVRCPEDKKAKASKKPKLTWWPLFGKKPKKETSPAEKKEISIAQEPTIQELSDGRFITIMRTRTGFIYYALSADRGHTWDTPRPLRYKPGGDPIRQPLAPCPLYKLHDGRFALIFHNNDGTANGGRGPTDSKRVRRPVWIAMGRETNNADHPLEFRQPHVLADNDRRPIGPSGHTQIGTYPSLFEHDGKIYFWYPDRKHFLLGKIIPPRLLGNTFELK
jgi:hypothetical protein